MPDISNEELIKLIKNNINIKDNYEKLYKQNHGFILQTIRKRVHGIYEIDDLMQQAYIALVKAVEYYDITRPSEESSFLGLLKYCIWNEIRNLKNDVPAHIIEKIIKYRRMYDKLYSKFGRKPTNDEISLHMNISLNALDDIKKAMEIQYLISLDEPIGEDDSGTRLDLYADQSGEIVNFNDNLEKEELSSIIHEAVDKLSEDKKEVINKKYFENLTLTEIGRENGVSLGRINQIEKKALRLLRKDKVLRKKAEGYVDVDFYHHVGLSAYNTTQTSSVEWVVLKREREMEYEEGREFKEFV